MNPIFQIFMLQSVRIYTIHRLHYIYVNNETIKHIFLLTTITTTATTKINNNYG